jgi:hypothetical protein
VGFGNVGFGNVGFGNVGFGNVAFGKVKVRSAGIALGARILTSTLALSVAAAVVSAHDPVKSRVTWAGDISPIFEARCVSCHSANARVTMPLATYEEARPWARAIKEEVITRRMPTWRAVRGYGDFSNDPSLSAFEIALIAAWADGGAPRGTEADARNARRSATPWETDSRPAGARDVALPCGEQPAPEGRLLAIRPMLDKGASVGISVRLPDGRREIVGWIRDFEPESPTTYRLRVPLVLPPTAIFSAQPAPAGCSVTLTLLEP